MRRIGITLGLTAALLATAGSAIAQRRTLVFVQTNPTAPAPQPSAPPPPPEVIPPLPPVSPT